MNDANVMLSELAMSDDELDRVYGGQENSRAICAAAEDGVM